MWQHFAGVENERHKNATQFSRDGETWKQLSVCLSICFCVMFVKPIKYVNMTWNFFHHPAVPCVFYKTFKQLFTLWFYGHWLHGVIHSFPQSHLLGWKRHVVWSFVVWVSLVIWLKEIWKAVVPKSSLVDGQTLPGVTLYRRLHN